MPVTSSVSLHFTICLLACMHFTNVARRDSWDAQCWYRWIVLKLGIDF